VWLILQPYILWACCISSAKCSYCYQCSTKVVNHWSHRCPSGWTYQRVTWLGSESYCGRCRLGSSQTWSTVRTTECTDGASSFVGIWKLWWPQNDLRRTENVWKFGFCWILEQTMLKELSWSSWFVKLGCSWPWLCCLGVWVPTKKWYLFTTLSQTEYCHFLAVTSLYRCSQKQYDNRSCWWDGAFDFIYASWLSFWKGVCCSHAIYAISFWFLPWQDVCPPVCLSVCLSHAGVLSKQLYISSNFLHHRIAPPFEFFYTKRYGNILTVTS